MDFAEAGALGASSSSAVMGSRAHPNPPTGDGSEETGKTKRQVLSCTTCRKRKVKCDRVQPCQACCARGQPKECTFVVTEKDDYEPIKQSYEIRELRKENMRLKERLRARKQAGSSAEESDASSGDRKRPPKVPFKPSKLQQRRFRTGDPSESLYFGSPGLASVVADFANMQLHNRPPASLAHTLPRGVDIFAYQDAPLYAFPTLWRADGGAGVLLACLPPRTELMSYLDTFQRRVQSCCFPHVPEEITLKEIDRFLANAEDNAFKHPDMLALIFAALALGLQNGVYDRSGGEWVEGAMEREAWKGDLYIAAAMQALRVASFMNRPTLLVIETLVMIGPYLTNSGKFLDAWALFGVTIRLAQSIGLHRHPKYLDPAPPLRESSARQSIWWWMLHMDQQYSMTLGRPLGISGIGDCPPPEPLTTNPTILRLSEYVNAFTILARQILSTDRLTLEKIDQYTDRLLALRDTLPEVVQFDESWLEPSKPIPEWPLDAQAAVFYGKTHNYLILLNRQRPENEQATATAAARSGATTSAEAGGQQDTSSSAASASSGPLRGRERVLASARSLLHAFEFFHVRVRPAMICWTSGQQAFNAAMILTLSLLNPDYTSAAAVHAARDDYYLVHRTYATFVEMHQKGIHRLAGVASSKLGALLMQLHPAASSAPGAGSAATPPPELKDSVMGNTGMMLLEDPGLQGFVADGFAPLGFQMAGSDLSSHGMPDVGTAGGAGLATGIGSPGWAARAAPAVPAPFPAAGAGFGAAFGAGVAPPPSMESGAGSDRLFDGFGGGRGGGPTPMAPWPRQQQQQQPAPSLASVMSPDTTGYGGYAVSGIGPSFASPMSSLRPAYGPSGAAAADPSSAGAPAPAPFGGVGDFHTGSVMAAGGAPGIVPAAVAAPPSPPPPVVGPKPDMLRLTSFSSA